MYDKYLLEYGKLEDGVPISDFVEFAGQQGYAFSVEDTSSELTDEALDAVSGGTNLATGYKMADVRGQWKNLLKGEILGNKIALKWIDKHHDF